MPTKTRGNLIYTSTVGMSPDEWLLFRNRGIGASEVGYIMGLSPYKSNVELFYEKIGEKIGYNIENIAMFMGTEMETFIANLWQYWNGDESTLIENFRKGEKVRKMQNVNAYIQNKKYPHIFVSLDRRINKYDERGNGCLEIKTISGFEADKWEGEIPPSHIVQVQTQMLVTQWKFGELAVLRDGRFFDVYPFEKHGGIQRAIVKETTDFWRRVERARIVLTQRYEANKNFNTRAIKAAEAELMTLEPNADGSAALQNFLKEKYKNAEPQSERMGTDAELILAHDHLRLKAEKKILDEKILLKENSIKQSMREIETITFGNNGKIYWKNGEDGTRRFQNKVKF